MEVDSSQEPNQQNKTAHRPTENRKMKGKIKFVPNKTIQQEQYAKSDSNNKPKPIGNLQKAFKKYSLKVPRETKTTP